MKKVFHPVELKFVEKLEKSRGLNILHLTAYHCYLDILEMLFQHDSWNINAKTSNATFNSRALANETIFFLASSKDHEKVVKFQMEKGADNQIHNIDGYFPIHISSEHGHFKVIKELLNDQNVDVNSQGYEDQSGTPLLLAAINGHLDVVQYLIDNGALVNVVSKEDNQSPLQFAALSGNHALVDFLLKNHSDLTIWTSGGLTAFHLASLGGHTNVLKILISYGGRGQELVNEKANVGVVGSLTPLHLSASKGHLDTVQFQVESGAEMEVKSVPRQNTPLHVSAENGHDSITEFLVKHGANIEACNASGETPIWKAVHKGHKKTLKMLIKAGANLSICSPTKGYSLLHLCAQENHPDILKILIENGCDINAKTLKNKSALWAKVLI